MEDKKTLWIVLCISLCVLIVAAVGFFWFLPSDESLALSGDHDGSVNQGNSGFDPVEWVRQDETFPVIEDSDEAGEDFVVVSDEVVYGIPEDKEPSMEGNYKTVNDKTANGKTVNDKTVVEVNTDQGNTITLDIRKAEPEKKVTVNVSPAASVTRPAEKTQPVQAKPGRTQTSPATEKKPVRVTEYWIQAGSFSSLSKASDVKKKLAEKGTTSTISTTKIKGTNYYRVRLGPYSDQMEADKFLSWVKRVKGFEKSYVSEVYVTK